MRKALKLAIVIVAIAQCAPSYAQQPNPWAAWAGIWFRTVVAPIDVDSSLKVAVGVYDERPDVIGAKHGGYTGPFSYNRFPYARTSERDLPLGMTRNIVEELEWANVEATGKRFPLAADESVARKLLFGVDADRFIMVSLRKWRIIDGVKWYWGDSQLSLIYNVSLRVYDRERNILAERHMGGKDDIPKWTSSLPPRRFMTEAYQDWLRRLFDDDKVKAALR